MRRYCTPGVILALALLLAPCVSLRAEPEEGVEVTIEIVGRVGVKIIARFEVLHDLGIHEEKPTDVDESRFQEALRNRAWRLAAVHLAEETGLVVANELVADVARAELANRARRLSEETGEACTADHVLWQLRTTRFAFEQECRHRLLEQVLGLFQQEGRHALEAGWRPEIDPGLLRSIYDASREDRPDHDVPFEEDRTRIEDRLRTALRSRAVARLILELAREPGFIEPPRLARAVEARAREVLHELEPLMPASKSEAPPLPDVVLTSYEAALEEAAASGCLLYLHVDPTPADAERVVADETLEKLATRYVVAVVSGRVGERAADRLRLRYGLMRPGAMSLAIAPSGTLVDRDVPFDIEGAWAGMQAAERAAASAVDEGAVPLCAQQGDEPLVQLHLDPVPVHLGKALTLSVLATNDTAGPIEQMRATVLLQGPRGGPRLVVLTLGSKHTEPGYREMATYELKLADPGWLHLLAVVEGGPELCRAARVRAYVR